MLSSILVTVTLTVTCVLWEDATGYAHEWVQADETESPEVIVSCGIFLKEEDGHLYLAMDKALSDEAFNGIDSIPLGWIEDRYDMRIELEEPVRDE